MIVDVMLITSVDVANVSFLYLANFIDKLSCLLICLIFNFQKVCDVCDKCS